MPDLTPLLAAFAIIAIAELGDKTQLLTMSLATRYSFFKVILGVAAASAVLMGIAVTFGGLLNKFIPLQYVQIFAGVLFIFFGIWSYFQKEEEEHLRTSSGKSPFLIVFTAFFLAELGDKTQLATLALAARYGSPLQVWLGATSAMVMINLIGAVVGKYLRKFIPEFYLKILASGIFIVFGLLILAEALFR